MIPHEGDPTPIPGSKRFKTPRSVNVLPTVRMVYHREHEKIQRSGAGRISPTVHDPKIHKRCEAIKNLLKLHVLKAKLSSCFLEAYKNGDISKNKKSPFSDIQVELMSNVVSYYMSEAGFKFDYKIHDWQPFRLNVIKELATMIGDPDWELPDSFKQGVHMADQKKIKEVGLWPDKCEANYDRFAPYIQWDESYKSAEENPGQVKKMLKEEIENGFLAGPHSKDDLLKILKCDEKDIAVGRMGLILECPKSDKWRLVFDATISGVNWRIQIPEKQNYRASKI